MPKIKERLDSLEKLDPYRGCRPPGLSDAEFAAYLCRMTPHQLRTYLRGLQEADLDASIGYLQGIVISSEEQRHVKS
jgi:hypothetical protein